MDRSRSGQGRLDRTSLDSPHAHIVGIDGREMSGLAQNLVQTGMAVTGSVFDASTSLASLRSLGVRVAGEPASRAITARTRLLVHGPEVDRCHSARLGALRRGVRQETPATWLQAQMQGRLGVAVAGGREACVAAAMIGLVLERANLDPTVVLGTAATQLGGWSREGQGPHFVAEWTGEADDYAIFRPKVALLLNVGSDPWVDLERWSETLRRSLHALPDDGAVLALGHPSLLDSLPGSERVPGGFQWVSLQRGADWWGADLREESGRFRFRVFHRGRYVIEIRLGIPGRRSVLAALAAVATCDRLGVSLAAIREGLEEFDGLARDFESRGSFRGVTLVDDESDDAASIRDVLALARRSFGARRIWAVYTATGSGEPRRLAAAFSGADQVLVIEGEANGRRITAVGSPSRVLTHALTDAGITARRSENLVEAISVLDRHLEPGDVLLTLGAGDVGTIADAFIRRLS